MSTDFVKVGPKKNFPEGSAHGVQVNGQDVCIVNLNGQFHAFHDRCTHAESLLSPGELEGEELMCPLHGARFSVKTGEPLTLPAVKPVKIYEVKTEGDDVLVKLN